MPTEDFVTADRLDRTRGCLLGLAAGDALGLAADFHRTVRSPWVRSRMWEGSAELDAARVAKPLLPFDTATVGGRRLVPTDDTENAVLAVRAGLTATDRSPAALFEVWRRSAGAPDAWTGVAERSAVLNAARGAVPPQTGIDNPADANDGAVPGGVAFGLLDAGDPDAAARDAAAWASVTHTRDGAWAASCMAAAVSLLVTGTPVDEALDHAATLAPAGSWLASGLARAATFQGRPLLATLPDILESLSPRLYSQPGTAPETLPLAFLVARSAAEAPADALAQAMLFAREQDSVPAFVGALVGAAHGSAVLGGRWPAAVDEIEGLLYPDLAGTSLSALAEEVVAQGR